MSEDLRLASLIFFLMDFSLLNLVYSRDQAWLLCLLRSAMHGSYGMVLSRGLCAEGFYHLKPTS